ncbi:putative site-specific recombinase [Sulfitobacter donghicola DSW-25 = KCTC 12864 = JCM 14565]|uniref:hypothetical protein n=1 Tax=Sulfitobacter donghicola TaxID=421000 RepID=UPI0004698A62|nr:hypothetical protein [Sulfitobacter donghicola]KIN65232.1 putative site-specific recombinase [Sulfitobacter donghicola DSW-25 = KCTC 12864 = JCM 14565]
MGTLLSASQAAKEVGRSIPTITRAIKKGKLSAVKTEEGGYQIDPAELFRVWPAIKSDATPERGNATGKKLAHATPKNADVTGGLEAEVKFLKQLLEDRDGTIADLKDQRDKWQEQAKTLLISNQNAPTQATETRRGGLLGFLRGNG